MVEVRFKSNYELKRLDAQDVKCLPENFDEVLLFSKLLSFGEIESMQGLISKGGYNPIFDLSDEEIWENVTDKIDCKESRKAFKQAELIFFDYGLAIVTFENRELFNNYKNKFDLLEKAFFKIFGYKIKICLNDYIVSPEEELEEFGIKPENTNLNSDQQQALIRLKNFTRGNASFFRLQGYAGTGKSFLMCEYIKWLNAERISYIAACPTNKAAKSLRNLADEAGLDLEVKTVAQLLGQQPELNETTGKEEFVSKGKGDLFSEYRIIIIDEFSMVNRENFNDITSEAYNYGCKVIFVGDGAQLPPIKEKEPMAVSSKLITQDATLTDVVRYDGDIARVAEAIRSNPVFPNFTTAADKTIVCLREDEWLHTAISLFESEEYKLNPDYVRFLAWRNKTVESLNNYVRLHLWGEEANPYVPGDRLIACKPLFRPKPGGRGKNKWRIFLNNSEESRVTQQGVLKELKFNKDIYRYWEVMVQPEIGKEQKLLILHDDSKELHAQQVKYYATKKQWSYYFDLSRMFDDVGYAYALTTHKAQGSTIDNVFLDVLDMKRSGDRNKLLYTALTRTRKQAFVLDN